MDNDGDKFVLPTDCGDNRSNVNNSASNIPFSEKQNQQQGNSPSMKVVDPGLQPCLTSKVSALNDVTRESLYSCAQQVIDDLNAKRKQDTQLLSDMKRTFQEQVEKTYNQVEQHMFTVYEKKGSVIQTKLQELYICLDRIEKIELELHEFKEALKILYQEMTH